MLQRLRDPLYKNSIFLMLSSVMGAGTGFLFWVLAAKIYPAEAVGLSSAMISAMRLIALISMLGLNTALIRFIPESDDEVPLINSSLVLVSVVTLATSLSFIFLIDILSPSLKILKKLTVSLLFIAFTWMLCISSLIGQGIFMAFRRGDYTFIQSLSSLPRLFILPLLIPFGALGVFLSFCSGMLIAFVISIPLLLKLVKFRLGFGGITDMMGYAFGVYIAGIFEMLPGLLLPIMVLNVLGAEMNAYFFIAWSIMFFTTMIARSTSRSLLAECSYNRGDLRIKAIESLKFVFLLLFVAIAVFYAFGERILMFFGRGYAENALQLLRILLIGCIPYSFNVVYAHAMMVLKELRRVVAIYGGIALITIGLGYLLMLEFGLIGLGYAWILANGAVCFSIILRHGRR